MQRTNGGKFLDTFWDLANEELRVRIDAAASLVDLLKQGDAEMAAYAVRRLCGGLESSRGGARRGFGSALSCCLEAKVLKIENVVDEISRRAGTLGWGPGAIINPEMKKKKSTQQRSEERGIELGVLLSTLCVVQSDLALSESEAKPLVMICIAAVERRQWLRELGTRCIGLLIQRSTKKKNILALIDVSPALGPFESDELATEPEQIAMRVLFNKKLPSKKKIVETFQPALSKAARSFPAIHCAWKFLLERAGIWPGSETFDRTDVWNIIDHEATHGSLERRGTAILLTEIVACGTNSAQLVSLALSSSICKIIVGATKTNSKSHLRPLAQRLLKHLVSSSKHKTSDWRFAVASALTSRGDSRFDTRTSTDTVSAILSGESVERHATFLVTQALAITDGRRDLSVALEALRGLVLSCKSQDISAAQEVRALLLALCVRLAYYHDKSFVDFDQSDRAIRIVLEQNANKLNVDENEKTIASRIFWTCITDDTTIALEQACTLESCFAQLIDGEAHTINTSSLQKLVRLMRTYLNLDEEAQEILDQELEPQGDSVEITAKSACTLLALAHETPAARAARLITVRTLNDKLHEKPLTSSTLDYLFTIAAGDKDNLEDDDDDEDQEEEDQEDDVDDESFGDEGMDEIDAENVPENNETDLEDDDIMLTNEELGELLLNQGSGAEIYLLAAKQAHRKAGAVRGVKGETQLQLRVLDLVDKAVCCRSFGDSAENTLAAVRGAIGFAVRGKEMEAWQDEVPEVSDWLKRVAQLVKQRLGRHAAKWGSENIEIRTEAARGLRLVLGNTLGWQRNASSLFLDLLVQVAALCVRCFHHDLSTEADQDACATYESAIPRCLGVKRAGLRIQILHDCIQRAPRLAVKALLPGLTNAISTAPSAFLQIEAVVLVRECLVAVKQQSIQLDSSVIESLATALVKQIESVQKSERARKLLDCIITLLEITAVPSASTNLKNAVHTVIQERFQNNGAIKHYENRISLLANVAPTEEKKKALI
uniref:Uncharacterized protein n=1 Tax=Aureoumbra lagunensis TaxID=44058 RepID=A0A7S3K038_9STRA